MYAKLYRFATKLSSRYTAVGLVCYIAAYLSRISLYSLLSLTKWMETKTYCCYRCHASP